MMILFARKLCWQSREKTQHICMKATPLILNSTFLQSYVMSVALQPTPYYSVCLQLSEHVQLFLNTLHYARRLKFKLNLICWRIQNPQDYGRKKEKCKSLQLLSDSVLPPPTPIIPLTQMPLVGLTVSRAEQPFHWQWKTRDLGVVNTSVQCNRKSCFRTQLA